MPKDTTKATEWLRARAAARVAILDAFAASNDVSAMTFREICDATGLSKHCVSRWMPRKKAADRVTEWNRKIKPKTRGTNTTAPVQQKPKRAKSERLFQVDGDRLFSVNKPEREVQVEKADARI